LDLSGASMKYLLAQRWSGGAQKDEGDADSQPKTLADMTEATKKREVNITSARRQSWDCVTLESSFTNIWASMLNKWADLAYQGDWEGLLRMETPVLINSRRLQKQIGSGVAQGRPPGGYTALHQAAWHGAPVEIVQALINLGARRWERTTNSKNDRPIDIARSKGHTNPALLALLEPPNLLPQWSQEDLYVVEKNFHDIIRSTLNGTAEDEQLRLPNLEILRELGEDVKVSMRVPGMYGGFTFWVKGDCLVSESCSKIVGGASMIYHITPKKVTLVDSDWLGSLDEPTF